MQDLVDPVTDEMLAKFVVDSHFRSQPKGANIDDKAFSESQEETRVSAGPADSKVHTYDSITLLTVCNFETLSFK